MLLQLRTSVIRDCNPYPLQTEKYGGDGSSLKVDFSRGDMSSNLNGLFTNTGLGGMLEAKRYGKFNMMLLFVSFIFD